MGVDGTTYGATFSNNVYLPEFVFVVFQMTFAMITPALIVGAFAERVKFSSLIVFVVLWLTFIYFPMAHMVWRSEEHTSELQSLMRISYAVFCLKKKTNNIRQDITIINDHYIKHQQQHTHNRTTQNKKH